MSRELALELKGRIGNALLQQQLNPYDIRVPGPVAIEALSAVLPLPAQQPSALDGLLRWDGGLVSYTLQNGTTTTDLPPLRAELSMNQERQPLVEVYSDDSAYPLLLASQLPDGFVKVGVTKQFTTLAGMQWPGSEPDHAVVLEVEQQLF